jgi:hypothetical protein
MREGDREAAVGGVRKSGLFHGGGVYAKPLLQYGKLTVPLIWPSSFVTLFGEKSWRSSSDRFVSEGCRDLQHGP